MDVVSEKHLYSFKKHIGTRNKTALIIYLFLVNSDFKLSLCLDMGHTSQFSEQGSPAPQVNGKSTQTTSVV
jgi:hypothetical protein